MQEQVIYLKFSPEITKALGAADVDIEAAVQKALADANVQATTEWRKDPTSLAEDKEVFLTILAVGVAVSLVGSAVSRIIDATTRRESGTPVQKTLRPALDGYGRPIFDRWHNPVYEAIETPGNPPSGETSETQFKAGKLLEFSLKSGAAAHK